MMDSLILNITLAVGETVRKRDNVIDGERYGKENWMPAKAFYLKYKEAPCKTCTDRAVGCHDKCKRYKDYIISLKTRRTKWLEK